MLSRPPIYASVIFHNASLSFESYVEQYANDDDFKEVYAKLTHGSQVTTITWRGNCCITLVNYVFPWEKECM